MTKLSPVSKEGREAAGGTGSTKLSRYRCVACGRSRSSTYHLRHPPEEPPPPQGICRRCVDKGEQKEYLPPEITIYEFHHYHHACTCQHEQSFARTVVARPLSPAYPTCAELPAEDFKDRSLSRLQLMERVPPPVAFWRKPSSQSFEGHRRSSSST